MPTTFRGVAFLAVWACVFALLARPACAVSTYSDLPSNECDVGASYEATMPCPGSGQSAIGPGSPNPSIVGARSIAASSANTAIDAHGYCRYVHNGSNSKTPFVPFNTVEEWAAFIRSDYVADAANAVTLQHCSRGGQVVIPPKFGLDPRDNQCQSITSPAQSVTMPYAPYPPSPMTTAATYSCVAADGTPFAQTAVATIGGADSAVGEPNNAGVVGWTVTNMSYAYNGVCGVPNGVAARTAPSSGLCHVGAASAVAQTGMSWTWTCAGGRGGGRAASCSAPMIVNGVCGAANGRLDRSPPGGGDLCAVGTPGGVGGAGPWNWVCYGVNGGGAVGCADITPPPCSPTSQQQDVGCPSGYSGSHIQQNNYVCPGGTWQPGYWSGWYDVTNTCAPTTGRWLIIDSQCDDNAPFVYYASGIYGIGYTILATTCTPIGMYACCGFWNPGGTHSATGRMCLCAP